MDRKGLVSAFIAAAMLASVFSVLPLGATSTTTLRFIFTDVMAYDILDVTTDPLGAYRDLFDSFTVEWIVEDVPDLTVWGCAISWDPAILECTSAAYGPTFKAVDPAAMQVPFTVDNTAGTIATPGESLITGSVSATVYPDAAILLLTEFRVIGFGATYLNWTTVSLLDSEMDEILPRNEINGYFNNIDLVPPPFPPTASFTFSPVAPYADDTVTFDASGSTGGFDGFYLCSITEYRWDWENDGVVDDVTALPTIDHKFTVDGTYLVNLTVYAPKSPGASPYYEEYDSEVKPVPVCPMSSPHRIDIYTNKVPFDGKGYWMPSDACEPGEEVTLYAKTTWNRAPVAGRPVTFWVYAYNKTSGTVDIPILTQTNMTTKPDGVCSIKFRITEPLDPINFGTWVCAAQAEIAELVVQDWVTFNVTWIVELISVYTIDGSYMPEDQFRRGECLGVMITLKNAAWVTKYAVITVTVKDDVGHLIAWLILGYDPLVPKWEVPPGDPITGEPWMGAIPLYCYLPIPKWAYPGVGEIEVSAYKNLPWLFPPSTGTLWCPEVTCNFAITYP